MLVQLTRFYNKTSTPGVLLFNGLPVFSTLELPWLENKQSISCIPEGEYLVTPHYSKRFGNVFAVHKVPNRSGILFHVGNYLKDTHGCILVGKSFTLNERGDVDILNSKLALDEMRVLLGKELKFILKINHV
jgi:hypothetical protein